MGASRSQAEIQGDIDKLIDLIQKGDVDEVNMFIGTLPVDEKSSILSDVSLSWGGYSALHYAAMSGSAAMTKALIAGGADVRKATSSNGVTPLLAAVTKNHIDVVRELLTTDVDVNAGSNSGNAPLHVAVRRQHLHVVMALLENKNIIVDAATLNFLTTQPLWRGWPDTVNLAQRIFDRQKAERAKAAGAPRESEVKSDDNVAVSPTSLQPSLRAPSPEPEPTPSPSAQMDSSPADKPNPSPSEAPSPEIVPPLDLVQIGIDLFKATEHGNLREVETILSKLDGLEQDVRWTVVNFHDSKGQIPLFEAARIGRYDLVEKLIAAGADVKLVTNTGATPLHIAAHQGHGDMVKKLIENHQMAPDVKDNEGATPLYWAASEGRVDVVELLLNNPAVDANIVTGGYTPLTAAAANKVMEKAKPVVYALLMHPRLKFGDAEEKDFRSKFKNRAFINKALQDRKKVLQDRAESLKLPHEKLYDSLSMNTVEGDFQQQIEGLPLEHIIERFKGGGTFLHKAVQLGKVKVVEKLLEKGASFNITDDSNRTPLNYAVINKNLDLIQVIVAHIQSPADVVKLKQVMESISSPLRTARDQYSMAGADDKATRREVIEAIYSAGVRVGMKVDPLIQSDLIKWGIVPAPAAVPTSAKVEPSLRAPSPAPIIVSPSIPLAEQPLGSKKSADTKKIKDKPVEASPPADLVRAPSPAPSVPVAAPENQKEKDREKFHHWTPKNITPEDVKRLITYDASFVDQLDPREDKDEKLSFGSRRRFGQLKKKILEIIKNDNTFDWVGKLTDELPGNASVDKQASKKSETIFLKLNSECALVDFLSRGRHDFENHKKADKKDTRSITKLRGILEKKANKANKARGTLHSFAETFENQGVGTKNANEDSETTLTEGSRKSGHSEADSKSESKSKSKSKSKNARKVRKQPVEDAGQPASSAERLRKSSVDMEAPLQDAVPPLAPQLPPLGGQVVSDELLGKCIALFGDGLSSNISEYLSGKDEYFVPAITDLRVLFVSKSNPDLEWLQAYKEIISQLMLMPNYAVNLVAAGNFSRRDAFIGSIGACDIAIEGKKSLMASNARLKAMAIQSADEIKFREGVKNLTVEDLKRVVTHNILFADHLDPRRKVDDWPGTKLSRAEKSWLGWLKKKILDIIEKDLKENPSSFWVNALTKPSKGNTLLLELNTECPLVDLLDRGRSGFGSHSYDDYKDTRSIMRLRGILGKTANKAQVENQSDTDKLIGLVQKGDVGEVNDFIETLSVDERPSILSDISLRSGFSALHYAAVDGSVALTKTLIEYGADAGRATSTHGETALFAAAARGHRGVVNALLAANVDVNVQINSSASPLRVALKSGYAYVVMALLQNDKIIVDRDTVKFIVAQKICESRPDISKLAWNKFHEQNPASSLSESAVKSGNVGARSTSLKSSSRTLSRASRSESSAEQPRESSKSVEEISLQAAASSPAREPAAPSARPSPNVRGEFLIDADTEIFDHTNAANVKFVKALAEHQEMPPKWKEKLGQYRAKDNGVANFAKYKDTLLETIKNNKDENWAELLGFKMNPQKSSWSPGMWAKNKDIPEINKDSALYYIFNQGNKKVESKQHDDDKLMTKHMRELLKFLAEPAKAPKKGHTK